MKILITGATGFVGRHLVPKLIEQKHSIFEITIEPEKSKVLYGNSTIQFHYKKNQDELIIALTKYKPEIVIHLASYLTANDDFETLQKLIEANIIFTTGLLDAIKNLNVKLFINTGTFAEYFHGNGELTPAYFYSATKTALRSFLKYYENAYKLKYCTVVPYTIYGGVDTQKKIIDIIYDSLNSDKPIDLSPGEQVLDFIHINDITDFYLELINHFEKVVSGDNFQLGTGTGHNLKQVAAIIENQTGKSANIQWGGKPYRTSDIMYAVAEQKNIKDQFVWETKVDIELGIKEFIAAK